jgi:carotenoid cleavage dioxygenase-like enzyme
MKEKNQINRRSFVTALGVAAGSSVISDSAIAQQPPVVTSGASAAAPQRARSTKLYRVEADIRDCEIDGKIPSELEGAFYRVGPDAQYPLHPRNIPFDGEGHVSMFHIHNGRVDYKSRFVRNDRYVAQEKAGRLLFPMYRNPSMDDPSVKGLSRSTANTHIINHGDYILALKEDSPPTAMDLLTLETLSPNYTFSGQLESATFTAHPKVCSQTGDIVAFGYEAKGFGTNDINVFQVTPEGKMKWSAWVKVPYIGLLHDFAVTQNYIVFYVMPLVFDEAQMKSGGIHWAWDGNVPTYFGVMRRYGDGKDIQWIKGPTRSSTHVMGAFDDGKKIYVDCEMSESNPFPFMPHRDGTRWDPSKGSSHIVRLSADLSKKTPKSYNIEQMYPSHPGALPRQDDRYNTMPYRYGFLGTSDPNPEAGKRGNSSYVRFDHETRKTTLFNAGPDTSLAECVFAPRSANASEGDGFLMGVANRRSEGRSDLVILDAQRLDNGPVATVKLPIQAAGQIHGLWVPKSKLPKRSA